MNELVFGEHPAIGFDKSEEQVDGFEGERHYHPFTQEQPLRRIQAKQPKLVKVPYLPTHNGLKKSFRSRKEIIEIS